VRRFAFLACLACLGCPLPGPTPVPGPSPAPADASTDAPDLFYGKIFDCHAAMVSTQWPAAQDPVEACLAGPPASCLAGLTENFDIGTVACMVRELGVEATVMVNGGKATDAQKAVAANADAFITAEQLGYR
jgi:hypothetical protein